MKEKNTEHHKYLVALTFDKKDEPIRIVFKLEKTDEDEIYLEGNGTGYYFSLAQFLQLIGKIPR